MSDGQIARSVAQYGYKVLTARGVHVYVNCKTYVKTAKIIGGDIKAHTGYVLGAGSVHPSGARYQAIDDAAPIFTVDKLSDILPDFFYAEQPPEPTQTIRSSLPPPPNDPLDCLDRPFAPLATEHLKSKVKIEHLLDMTRAIPTGPHKYLITCPFHDDEHPSFWVDIALQLCGCFSGCTRKPLDAINLYARLHGLNNRDAIFALQKVLA
jgi:hypothetical protein